MPIVANNRGVNLWFWILNTIGYIAAHEQMGVPPYVLEDRLFGVANQEDQTKEDLASKFY